MENVDVGKLRKEIAHDRLKSYYFTGKSATQEEIKEVIKRVKEQMYNMTADDFVPASEYWQSLEEKL